MSSYVVVGASRGLGYAWLKFLSQNPSNIVIGLVRTVDPVLAKLKADSITNVHVFSADMADHKSLTAAAIEVSNVTNGSLDFLIVNGAYYDTVLAGRGPSKYAGKEEELKKDMFTSVEVNLLGSIFSINAFLPLIRKGAAKRITVVASAMADLDVTFNNQFENFITYSAIKAALVMIVAKYGIELKPEGIITLAICPGAVNTSESPPTEEEIAMFAPTMQKFALSYPDWKGPMEPAESVEKQFSVIQNLPLEKSGAFLSHKGNKIWL